MFLALVVAGAGLLTSAWAGRSDQTPPELKLESLTATFIKPVTTYHLSVDGGKGSLVYKWSNTNPCGSFTWNAHSASADWSHPDSGDPNNPGSDSAPGACPNEAVHPGQIQVTVNDNNYACSEVYFGSGPGVSGSGPTCVLDARATTTTTTTTVSQPTTSAAGSHPLSDPAARAALKRKRKWDRVKLGLFGALTGAAGIGAVLSSPTGVGIAIFGGLATGFAGMATSSAVDVAADNDELAHDPPAAAISAVAVPTLKAPSPLAGCANLSGSALSGCNVILVAVNRENALLRQENTIQIATVTAQNRLATAEKAHNAAAVILQRGAERADIGENLDVISERKTAEAALASELGKAGFLGLKLKPGALPPGVTQAGILSGLRETFPTGGLTAIYGKMTLAEAGSLVSALQKQHALTAAQATTLQADVRAAQAGCAKRPSPAAVAKLVKDAAALAEPYAQFLTTAAKPLAHGGAGACRSGF